MWRRCWLATTLATAAALVSGCGSSSTLPPPAGPARSPALRERPVGEVIVARRPAPPAAFAIHVDGGGRVASVAARRRVLVVRDSRTGAVTQAPAGVGPTHAASDGHRIVFVVDTQGDALLLFHTRPRLELRRRVFLPGRPYAIALDAARGRLWITLTATNRLAEVTANGRPRVLRTLPTVRQPNAVALGPHGEVRVYGADPPRVQVVRT
jgi:hypothetical protein